MTSDLEFLNWGRQTPRRPALIERGQVVDFENLAIRVKIEMERLTRLGFGPTHRLAIAPSATCKDAIRLMAAIELRVPLVLLHPALPEVQQHDRAARLSARFSHDPSTPEETENQGVAAFLFTSGSTGSPKAVRLSRDALVHATDASAERLGWNPDDRWALFLPPAHIGGLSILLRCLTSGHGVVFGGGSAAAMQMVIKQQRVSHISIVPTQLRRLLDADARLPAHLRVILVGGAATSKELRARAYAAGYPTWPTYGMTEACSQVATALPGQAGYGRPLSGVELRIKEGQLAVRGPMLMDGYEGVPSPFDKDGFFRTGDLAHIDENGHLHIDGRVGDRIISGGENVDPLEVEQQLRRTGGFTDVAVFGVEDDEWGERVAVAAVLAGPHPHAAPMARLHSLCQAAELPGFARPRLGVVLDRLPRGPMGKLGRSAMGGMMALQLRSLRPGPSSPPAPQ